MSTVWVLLLPTRSNSRSWSTRRSLTCRGREMSPISSRKIVPPSAASNLPILSAIAPAKAPFTCPNSSDSRSVSDSAAQVTLTKGLSLLGRVFQEGPARADRDDPPVRAHQGAVHIGAGFSSFGQVPHRTVVLRRPEVRLEDLAAILPRGLGGGNSHQMLGGAVERGDAVVPLHRDHRLPDAVQDGGEFFLPGQGSGGRSLVQRFVADHATKYIRNSRVPRISSSAAPRRRERKKTGREGAPRPEPIRGKEIRVQAASSRMSERIFISRSFGISFMPWTSLPWSTHCLRISSTVSPRAV